MRLFAPFNAVPHANCKRILVKASNHGTATSVTQHGRLAARIPYTYSILCILFVLYWSTTLALVSGDSSHMVRIAVPASTTNASKLCATSASGYLPNLISEAVTKQMTQEILASDAKSAFLFPAGGTIGDSICATNSNCVWSWRAGPLSGSPVRFFVGKDSTGSALTYANWSANMPMSPTTKSQVFVLAATMEWRNSAPSTSVQVVVCEVKNPDENPVIHWFKNDFKWWMGVLFGVAVVVIIVIIVVLIYCCCCCCRKDDENPTAFEDSPPPWQTGEGSTGGLGTARRQKLQQSNSMMMMMDQSNKPEDFYPADGDMENNYSQMNGDSMFADSSDSPQHWAVVQPQRVMDEQSEHRESVSMQQSLYFSDSGVQQQQSQPASSQQRMSYPHPQQQSGLEYNEMEHDNRQNYYSQQQQDQQQQQQDYQSQSIRGHTQSVLGRRSMHNANPPDFTAQQVMSSQSQRMRSQSTPSGLGMPFGAGTLPQSMPPHFPMRPSMDRRSSQRPSTDSRRTNSVVTAPVQVSLSAAANTTPPPQPSLQQIAPQRSPSLSPHTDAPNPFTLPQSMPETSPTYDVDPDSTDASFDTPRQSLKTKRSMSRRAQKRGEGVSFLNMDDDSPLML